MSCKLIETSNAAAKAVAPGTKLPEAAEAALREALEGENRAVTRYAAAIAAHGEVAPFAKLLPAQRRHAAALATMMKAYGLPVAKGGRGQEGEPLPGDLAAACAVCAEERAEQLRRYDETLIPAVAGFPGLVTVLSAVRNRASNRHLPALRRGVTGEAEVPHLRGHTHHHGHGGCGHHRCHHGHA